MIPKVLVELMAKVDPGFAKSTLYKVIEYGILAIMLYGLYADISGNLQDRTNGQDQAQQGYAVQIGVTRHQVQDLEQEVNHLRDWNKALSARVNRLEDVAIKRSH